MTQATTDIIQLISQGWTADIIWLEIWDHPVQLSQWLSQQRLRLTSANSSRGAGDCCPMYLLNSWALDWSSDSRTWSDSQPFVITHCYILYHIITLIIITYYYILYFYIVITMLLHIITFTIITLWRIITKSWLCIITSLLSHYYNVITTL